MKTWADDAKKALFDCLLWLETLSAFWLIWVESWMPVWKGYPEANDEVWVWFIIQGLFFGVVYLVVFRVTWGAKQRRYPPPPKPIVVVSPSAATEKPPSDLKSIVDDIEERLEALENRKQ